MSAPSLSDHAPSPAPDRSEPPAPWLVHGPMTTDVRRLRAWRDAGITTVLDTGTDGVDRPAPTIAGMDIVRGIGIGTAAETTSTERLLAHLLDEIDRCPTGATFLTCEIDGSGLLIGVERTLRAIGTAHVLTGVPVLVCTDSRATTGLDVAQVFGEEFVDPRSVLLTGCGDTTDVEHLTELADLGYRLGIDRSGSGTPTPTDRVDVVAELCRRGHAHSMVLVPDLTAGPPGRPDLAPALHHAGVRPTHLDAMLCGTLRSWLGR